ncbi:VOC family protein [Salipaludibacillus sp. CF4.18]|uniref:VOC family protein n=1 Tax=Salipaludibacillus sp. CF4.18 TaxID=3373081 RepID=UPI003EE7FDC1
MKMIMHHQNISTNNVEEMTKFYKDVLGLEEAEVKTDTRIMNKGYDKDTRFLNVDNGCQVHISQKDPNNGFTTGHYVNLLLNGHIAFRVDDIEEMKKRLNENNIQFSDFGEWAIKGWYQIFVYDPDGNVIEFQQEFKK